MDSKKRVAWLIEDNQALADLIAEALESMVEVQHFDRAEKPLQMLRRSFRPDMIITDFKLPDDTGIEFLKKCALLGIDCPSIMISGFADKELALAAIDLGVAGFVEKPFDLETLTDLVTDILRDLLLKESLQNLDGCLKKEVELRKQLNSIYSDRLASVERLWEAEGRKLVGDVEFVNRQNAIEKELSSCHSNSTEIIQQLRSEFRRLRIPTA